jgi:hypothetical protein
MAVPLFLNQESDNPSIAAFHPTRETVKSGFGARIRLAPDRRRCLTIVANALWRGDENEARARRGELLGDGDFQPVA